MSQIVPRKGKFITFEGGEGTGKSTQVHLLVKALHQQRIPILQTREPGGSLGAERIRTLLVKGEPGQWDPLTEVILFLAARRDHVENVIKPALNAGKWVICDRFHESTIAYSVYGHGLERATIDHLYQLIIGDFHPDLVLILSADPKLGLRRASSRGDQENRIEKKGLEFHQRVYKGYLEIAHSDPKKYVLINASDSIEKVHDSIMDTLNY